METKDKESFHPIELIKKKKAFILLDASASSGAGTYSAS
jgi:hypothetical protein